MEAVAERFNLPKTMPQEVKDADFRILSDEGIQNMGGVHPNWADPKNAFGVKLQFWSPTLAKMMFLDRLVKLQEMESWKVA